MTPLCTPRVTATTPMRQSLDWDGVTIENTGQGQCTLYLGTLAIELTAVQAQQPDTLISVSMDGVQHLPPVSLCAGQALPSGVTLDEISLLPMVQHIQRVLDHYMLPYEIMD